MSGLVHLQQLYYEKCLRYDSIVTSLAFHLHLYLVPEFDQPSKLDLANCASIIRKNTFTLSVGRSKKSDTFLDRLM